MGHWDESTWSLPIEARHRVIRRGVQIKPAPREEDQPTEDEIAKRKLARPTMIRPLLLPLDMIATDIAPAA